MLWRKSENYTVLPGEWVGECRKRKKNATIRIWLDYQPIPSLHCALHCHCCIIVSFKFFSLWSETLFLGENRKVAGHCTVHSVDKKHWSQRSFPLHLLEDKEDKDACYRHCLCCERKQTSLKVNWFTPQIKFNSIQLRGRFEFYLWCESIYFQTRLLPFTTQAISIKIKK